MCIRDRLYILNNETVELVDSQVKASEFGGSRLISNEGNLSAYLKSFDLEISTCDLYIMATGKNAQKVSDMVYVIFDFLD